MASKKVLTVQILGRAFTVLSIVNKYSSSSILPSIQLFNGAEVSSWSAVVFPTV